MPTQRPTSSSSTRPRSTPKSPAKRPTQSPAKRSAPRAATRPAKKPAPRQNRTTPAAVVMYLVFALVFVVMAFYTVLHLVFFGFSGEPVGIDFGLGLLLPLLWIVGLLRAVATRAQPAVSLAWGITFLVLVGAVLAFDTVRFTPILFG
jgi:hypothetical protein